jgi:LmbE family N-acetylglucosaminyl deacetylase
MTRLRTSGVALGALAAGLLTTLALRGLRDAPHAATAPPAAQPAGPGPTRPIVTPLGLPARPRVMVFAPHPDDETIALGGLIARLARAGAPVRVVFVTNGDGYPRAVEQDFDVERPTDADYVAFGALRQREAVAALAHLGVSRRQIRFLGFPDGGLADLWRAHWLPSHPYTSPYTGEASPPDDGVGFDGQDLTSALVRAIADFRPTVIVMPHPYDTHLDHAHTSYFVTEALTRVQARGSLPSKVAVLTYVVHYPSWPATAPPAFDRFLPLGKLPDTAWTETELSPAEVEAKRAALAEYHTQLAVMNGFLRNFLCRNELFATVDGHVLERIASIH